MASRRGRSTASLNRWVCVASRRIRSAGCAAASTIRSRRSAAGRWRAPTPICGWTPRSSGSASPGGVRQKALVIAYAVHESGRREVLGLDVGEAETEAFWAEFLFSLKARGLTGIRLCVSDAHQGLRNAIARVLGCRWRRCSVHFLRDMLGHCARTQQPMIATAIRQIFQADTGQEARERLVEVTDRPLASTEDRPAA